MCQMWARAEKRTADTPHFCGVIMVRNGFLSKPADGATLGLAVELLLHIPGLTRYAEGQFVITVSIYGNVRSSVME